jgi:hypothetical protein
MCRDTRLSALSDPLSQNPQAYLCYMMTLPAEYHTYAKRRDK